MKHSKRAHTPEEQENAKERRCRAEIIIIALLTALSVSGILVAFALFAIPLITYTLYISRIITSLAVSIGTSFTAFVLSHYDKDPRFAVRDTYMIVDVASFSVSFICEIVLIAIMLRLA